jgi:heme-degrading monooxygenase HmoA
MFARVNRFQDTPDNLDESDRIAETEIVPQLQTVPGFLGVLSLADRATGGSLAITFWETEEAMRASEPTADRVRAELKERTGAEIRTVERYEVTLRAGL